MNLLEVLIAHPIERQRLFLQELYDLLVHSRLLLFFSTFFFRLRFFQHQKIQGKITQKIFIAKVPSANQYFPHCEQTLFQPLWPFGFYAVGKETRRSKSMNRSQLTFSIDLVYKSIQSTLVMLGQESAIFPKQIKIDDYSPFERGNVISILQSSNLLLGSGSRTSNAAIVLAKTLHYLEDEGELKLKGKRVLDLGCGAGLIGIYLACLGSQVLLADLPSIKDLAERNIGINKSTMQGKAEFIVANWKNSLCTSKCEELGEGTSSTSTEKQQCLKHLITSIDLTIICEGGGMSEVTGHLQWLGREGLILCFLQREGDSEDTLTSRALEELLLEREVNYEKMNHYHPDYVDERVAIFHIWR